MSKFVTIHKIDEDVCKTSASYELIGSREDVLRRAVMQGFFKRLIGGASTTKRSAPL